MGINIFGGRPTSVVAKQTISFIDAGITVDNTAIIYLVDDPLKSYVPGRGINGITGFVKNKGYYFIAIQDMDLQNWTIQPITPSGAGVALIIFNGESNSGGQALNSQATSGELLPRTRTKILNNTTLTSFDNLQIGVNNMVDHAGIDNGTTHGFELAIANEMDAVKFIEAPCYLCKTGQGGSSIVNWAEGGPLLYSTVNCWQKFTDRVDAAIDIIETATGTTPTLYMLYSQGLNDIGQISASDWKAATIAHFAAMRTRYGQFPIIMTKFMSGHAEFNSTIDEIAAELSEVYAVSAVGATLKDSQHWDYAGMKLIGGRMMQVLLQNYSI